jgi:sterol 24-C-methyltransferase
MLHTKNSHNRKNVISYYESLESRLGYTFLTWDTKHFGYYPPQKPNITEKEAQELMIDLLISKLQLSKNDVILDAGCGRGITSCYIAKKHEIDITGIDIVLFELKIARKKAKEFNLNNKVKFLQRDYSNTKFTNNYFDKVFTLETLVHSPDFKKTLQEFRRILKPKGRLVLFEYSKSRPEKFNHWEQTMIDTINKGSSMTSFQKMYHNTLVKDVKKAGFRIISEEQITEYMLPSLKRFYKYAILPYLFIKFFKLQKFFINTTAGVEFYRMMKKGLIQYRVVVAEKT